MPLLTCQDCGHQVSDRAATCPKCGAPTGATQLVEQTAKKWKFLQLTGLIMAVVGLGLIMQTGGEALFLFRILVFGGIGMGVIGSVCAWWFHA